MSLRKPDWQRHLLVNPHFRQARLWCNDLLRPIAGLCEGDVITVSAWKDEDKEEGHVKDHFVRASTYAISNYGGCRGAGDAGEIELDLEAPLPQERHGRSNVADSHTILEHVLNAFAAVRNLRALSKEIVIVIVPCMQKVHDSKHFSDYWRVTVPGNKGFLEANGMEAVYLLSSHGCSSADYDLCLESRHPERWCQRLEVLPQSVSMRGCMFRRSLFAKAFEWTTRAPWL